MYWSPAGEPPPAGESSERNWTQHSIVKFVGSNVGESGICTKPFVPSKLKAAPTTPAAFAVAPPCRVPEFVPMTSEASPSPGHHEIRLAGGGTQSAKALPAIKRAVRAIGNFMALTFPVFQQVACSQFKPLSPSRHQNCAIKPLWECGAIT